MLILILTILFMLLLIKMRFNSWKIELFVWAQLWAIVHLIILDWKSCFKRNKLHMFMHITHSTHMHTLHIMITLILMCIVVYKCTYCSRKCHLAKFCYDKTNAINFASKNVWVPNHANPHGPKRKWVPKFSPLVFDVGVGSHMTWEDWCLGGGCMG